MADLFVRVPFSDLVEGLIRDYDRYGLLRLVEIINEQIGDPDFTESLKGTVATL